MFVELALGGLHLSVSVFVGAAHLACLLVVRGCRTFLVGNECVLCAFDHTTAGAGLSQGLPALRGAMAAGRRRWSRAEACRGEACPGGGCDVVAEGSEETSLVSYSR